MNRQQRQLCFTFKYYDKRGTKKHVASKLKHVNGLRTGNFEAMENKSDNSSSSQGLENNLVLINQKDDKVKETLPDEEPKKPKKRNRDTSISPAQSASLKPDKELDAEPVQKKRKQRSNAIIIAAKTITENSNLVLPVVKDLAADLNIQSASPVNGIVTPPRMNGDFQVFPVNGELSPNSALKLKIRKVRPLPSEVPGKRKRGRPPKVRETFVIVNPPEEKKDQQTVHVDESKKTVADATCSSLPTHSTKVEQPKKKRGRPRKVVNIAPSQEKKVTAETERAETPIKRQESPVKRQESPIKRQESPVKGQESPVKKQENGLVVGTAIPPLEVEGSVASSNDDDTASTKSAQKREKETVCVVCEQLDNLIFCEGVCGNAYHADCIGLSSLLKVKFTCDECTTGNHSCFSCKQTGNVRQCSQPNCTKFYHENCLKSLKTVKFDGDRFFCPLHTCSTCAAKNKTVARGKLSRCVRCPTAYHMSGCLVAGCIPISAQLMTCAKHFMPEKSKAHHSHVNVNWCFVCSIGGTLICCESCPAAFHPECISYEGIPEGHFFCKDCIDGKQLLYGDIIWVKLGMYRYEILTTIDLL